MCDLHLPKDRLLAPLFFLQSSLGSLYIKDYCHCNVYLFLFRITEFPGRTVSVPVWHGRLCENDLAYSAAEQSYRNVIQLVWLPHLGAGMPA